MAEKTYSGFVAIVGKPNVGKSTLLNNLLGVKVAPISPRPQTTRKRLRGILTEGRRQIVFVDTPGLHKPMDALGEFMDQEVYEALADVNAVVWVVDLRHPPTPEDELVARALKPLVGKVPILLVGNKLDAAKYPEEAMKAYHELLPEAEPRMLSALDERQVAELKADLLALMPEGLLLPGGLRQKRPDLRGVGGGDPPGGGHEAPLARGALRRGHQGGGGGGKGERRALHQGHPLRGAPLPEGHRHRRGRAEDQGDRSGHEEAAHALLGKKVYLDLEVKVYPDWRKDPEALRELGYRSSVG